MLKLALMPIPLSYNLSRIGYFILFPLKYGTIFALVNHEAIAY